MTSAGPPPKRKMTSPPSLQLLPGSASTCGIDFELKMAALVKVRARRLGLDFTLYRNVRDARPLDDLVLRFSTGGDTCQALIQLKHAEKKEESLTLQAFCPMEGRKNTKGDFNLRKYYEALHKMYFNEPDSKDVQVLREIPLERTWLVIYTNRRVKGSRSRNSPLPNDKSFHLLRDLLATSSQSQCCFRFDESDPQVWNLFESDEREPLYQQQFLSKLLFFDSQSHVSGLDDLIKREMANMFGEISNKGSITTLFDKFQKVMREWESEPDGRPLHRDSGLLERAIGKELRRRAQPALLFTPSQCEQLLQALQQSPLLSIQVPGVPPGVRAAKLIQALQKEGGEYFGKWLYVDDHTMKDYPMSLITFASKKSSLLILDFCQKTEWIENIIQTLRGLNTLKLITFDSSMDLGISPSANAVSDEWKWEHLAPECQEEMKRRPIVFQGHETTFGDLLRDWPQLHEHVDADLIASLWKNPPDPPRLSSALPSVGEERNFVTRALHHQSALKGNDVLDVLQRIGANEKLALSGFSREEIESLRQTQIKQKDSSQETDSFHRYDTSLEIFFHELFPIADLKYGWTVLWEGEDTLNEEMFEMLCAVNPQYTFHWIERNAHGLVWKDTNSDRNAISQLVNAITSSCVNPPSPQCLHRGDGGESDLLEEATSWDEGPYLLVGEPGMGKTQFMRSVAKQRKEQRPHHWVLMVEVLQHSDVLERMPAATAIHMEHVHRLLAAAAGIEGGSAAGRFLRSAVARGAAIAVFVDGVDEVCPLHKDKILACLRLLRRRVRPLWVASRTEVESSLREVLQCIPLHLSPLSRDEQERYLCQRWNTTSHSSQKIQDLVCKVIDMFTPLNARNKQDRSLLEVPLNLSMTADIFENKLQEGALQEIPNLNVLQLYSSFVEKNRDRHRERFHVEDARLKNTNVGNLLDKSFKDMHQSYAMCMLVQTLSLSVDKEHIEASCNEWKEFVGEEKNGLLWLNHGHLPQFSHRTFMEYFAAQWIFDHKETGLSKSIIRELMRNRSSQQLKLFLDMMLAEGFPTHEAIIIGQDVDEAALRLEAERDSKDGGGRSLLHLAAVYGRDALIPQILSSMEAAARHRQDELLRWTPLQYADACFRLAAAEKLLEAGADPQQLAAITESAAKELTQPIEPEQRNFVHLTTELSASQVSKRILQRIKMINGKLHYGNEKNQTILHIAVDEGYCKLVQVLLDAVENVDVDDSAQNSPLSIAVLRGHGEIVETLISRGVDFNKANIKGCTLLHVAALRGHKDIVERLLSISSIQIDAKDKNSWTPLAYAIITGQTKTVDLLLSKGANAKKVWSLGDSALHQSAYLQQSILVEMLIKKFKMDVNICDDNEETPLKYAVTFGHSKIVKQLISLGANVNKIGKYGESALHVAASFGHSILVDMLIKEFKMDVNICDDDGDTPLYYALRQGHREIVKQLISLGANVNKINQLGESAIHSAAYFGFSNLVYMLIKELKMDVNICDDNEYTPLHCAVREGHSEIVKQLISLSANVNKIGLQGSALHVAASFGHPILVEMLVKEFKMDVNICDNNEETPLSYAVREGHIEIVKQLINLGAKIINIDKLGESALHEAAFSGHSIFVDMFIKEFKMDVNICDDPGQTPLYYALRGGHREIVKQLISLGANVNKIGLQGESALHVAASFGHPILVDMLVKEFKMDVNICDDNEETPLSYAVREGHIEIVKQLVSLGANIINIDKLGECALHVAASSGHSILVDMLIKEFKIDVNICDDTGQTPLNYALRGGHREIVKQLISLGANVIEKGK